jgi:tetratricopeptide (TPR) repeat protein
MNNSRRFTRQLRILSRKKITMAGLATAAVVAVFCCVTAYYYFTTPSDTILVTTSEFPPGLATNFNNNTLTNHVEAQLKKIIGIADSGGAEETYRLEGIGPRAVKQTLIPIRAKALSDAPSPIYKLKLKGVDLNLCRTLGMTLRANRYLELGVLGVPQGGWRLTAYLKDGPDFTPKSAGSAPQAGGSCSDFEKCANELTEQILEQLDYQRLLKFHIKTKTEEANRRILDLYNRIPATSLQADDFVAWGNAHYGVNELNDALLKYEEALRKDPNSCPAHAARGFVYYSKARGGEPLSRLSNLQLAERDFRTGIACAPNNEFTHTSLCHTLLQKWNLTKRTDPALLVQAKEECEKALTINPQFVVAEVNLAYVLYRQGKAQEALAHLDELSHKHPKTSALFLNYGFLLYLEYLRENNPEMLRQAAAQTFQAWDIDKKSDIAANNLGFLYYEQGNYEQAVGFWNKANEISPNDAEYLAGLALSAYKRGDQGTAFNLLYSAINKDGCYSKPDYLMQNNYWSKRAASDLTDLIRLLPKPPESSNPCS